MIDLLKRVIIHIVILFYYGIVFDVLTFLIVCFFYARNTLFKDDVKIDTDTAVSAVDSAKSAASSFLLTQTARCFSCAAMAFNFLFIY